MDMASRVCFVVKKINLETYYKILNQAYKIFSLGDSAVTLDLGNDIREEMNCKVLAMQQWLLQNPFEGLKDVIVAYSSISIFYDPVIIKAKIPFTALAMDIASEKLKLAYEQASGIDWHEDKAFYRIPVCYDAFGFDLDSISEKLGLSIAEIIHRHSARTYRVYMIGFLPGFSYLGQVDESLMLPRKTKPVQVFAGSIGIVGGQTGIYPLDCMGGWNIIGRTPYKLFDMSAEPPVLLKAGDQVQFYNISINEFEALDGQGARLIPEGNASIARNV